MWGRILGVGAENWLKKTYIALLKFHMNPLSRLVKNGKNPKWPPTNILKKKRFLTSNPTIKCDMSFLAIFGAWNPLLDLKLQLYAT